MNQKVEMRAVRLFYPVVVVLFVCNIIPIVHITFIFNGIIYRELHIGMFTSFALNSAANMPIYYCKGSSFRQETKAMLVSNIPSLRKRLTIKKPQYDRTSSGTELSKV